MIPRFAAEVMDNGELRISDAVSWRARLAHHRGKRVWLIVQREKHARSLRANAYYWGVVLAVLSEWSGHTPEELHEAMKVRFLQRREVVLPTGEVLDAAGSTAGLDSLAFSEYVDSVQRFAAEQGCYVPEPDEVEVTL